MTKYEWECQYDYTTVWSEHRPPQPGEVIYKSPTCPKCHRPMTETTGNVKVER